MHWTDRPLLIVGGGPSAAAVAFDKLSSAVRVLGVNRAAFRCNADCVVSVDALWIERDRDDIVRFLAQGEDREAYLATPQQNRKFIPRACNLLKGQSGVKFSDSPLELWGTNSGFAALNLAWLKRAQSVHLVGFDLCTTASATHWHEGYSWTNDGLDARLTRWARGFDEAAKYFVEAGIAVYNYIGEPESRLDSFAKKPLEAIYEIAA